MYSRLGHSEKFCHKGTAAPSEGALEPEEDTGKVGTTTGVRWHVLPTVMSGETAELSRGN